MKYIQEVIKRGDIWWVELDPTQGSEINKTRPCVILTANTLNRFRKTVVVVPLSTSAEEIPPITVGIRSGKLSAVAVIDQVRAIGKHRLKSKMGTISVKEMQDITGALIEILELA